MTSPELLHVVLPLSLAFMEDATENPALMEQIKINAAETAEKAVRDRVATEDKS